jgi:tetraacyldisaccharide 4'-kinase
MIHSPLIRALLYPLAKVYEFVVRARIALYQKQIFRTYRLNAPVISVGNLTIGGAGKTPFAAFLANYLQDEGYKVAILSRGYKRKSVGRVEVSDGEKVLCGPFEAGDEPYLLAKSCPGVRVVVDRDRYAAGKWLESRAPISVFILDDAFQHLRLARDLNLLLIDAGDSLDEAEMLPFGRLREPIRALRRADAVIVTRSDQVFDRARLEQAISKYCRDDTPIFYAYHLIAKFRRLDKEEDISVMDYAGKRIAAVSGIARPERFIADLEGRGMEIALRRDFPDHHRYLPEEIDEIAMSARRAGAEAIITTEKDAANLPAESVKSSAIPICTAQISVHCEDENGLKRFVLKLFS